MIYYKLLHNQEDKLNKVVGKQGVSAEPVGLLWWNISVKPKSIS